MLTADSFWHDVRNAEPYNRGYWHGYYDLPLCIEFAVISNLHYDADYKGGWTDGQYDRWMYVSERGFGPGHSYPSGATSLTRDTFSGMIVGLMGDYYVFDPYCVLAASRHFVRYAHGWNGLSVQEVAKLRSV